MSGDPFAPFDNRTAAWFRSSVGEPTDVQERTWRAVAAGRNVLATAPTGSGKTLAAFLWALDALATGKLAADRLSVLYLSPLKALNNDIRNNLTGPLAGLREVWKKSGDRFPELSVATRSGDTSPAERRAFLREPPSILATTPESLALLLNSPQGRSRLASVRMVVLDEIHALAPTKRGAFLMVQVERLALLAGDFRRIALSATVADSEDTARFACGYRDTGDGRLEPRPIEIVRSSIEKKRTVSISYPSASETPETETPDGAASPARWPVLADAFVEAVSHNRTTLIFTNSRRHAEKIAFLMNERTDRTIAWAHHGSLSREVRSSVEARLKSGELPAVVATSSLELGIDIGSVDEVLLAGTPGGAAATQQRIGRAGHQLGAESRGRLFPLHGLDLLLATAVARDAAEGRLEREGRPHAPLDVLAQLILSMTAMDAWRPDALYDFFLRSESFHTLSRTDFDLVVAMLRGRYAGSRLEALRPRLERADVARDVEAADGSRAADEAEAADTDDPESIAESGGADMLRARSGVLPLLYRGGGVIPDRGSFALTLAGSGANLGELDEEFVWERRLGDTFSLGTRSWRITAIDDRAVSVTPWERGINILPFWRAENQWRSEEAMETVLDLLDDLPETPGDGGPPAAAEAYLRVNWSLDGTAAKTLARFLALQRAAAALPGRYRVVLETFHGPGGQGTYLFLHTLRGGRVNAALGIALRAAADRRFGTGSIEFFWDDAGILAAFPALEEDPAYLGAAAAYGDAANGSAFSGDAIGTEAGPESIAALLSVLNERGVTPFLRAALESTGLFGAAFREAAGRALLLPKAPFGKRTPLWISRLRSRKLYEAVRSYADFPMVKEAWRSCLEDMLDVGGAERLVAGIGSGSIETIESASAAPSLLARGSVWLSADSFMYRRDDGSSPSSLSDELLGELLSDEETVAAVDAASAKKLIRRIKRLDGDYLPGGASELADWLDERLLIDEDEWNELLGAMAKTAEASALEDASQVESLPRFRHFSFDGGRTSFIVSPDFPENTDPSAVLPRWLRYAGPVSEARLGELFAEAGLDAARALLDEGALTRLALEEDGARGAPLLCDAELASRLLRFARAERRRAAAAARPLAELQGLAAARAGIRGELRTGEEGKAEGDIEAGVEALRSAMESLLGSAVDAELWEREILPARTEYRSYHLELLLRRGVVVWYGRNDGRVGFALDEELDLTDRQPRDEAVLSSQARSLLAALRSGSATLRELSGRAGLEAGEAASAVRELAAGGYARTERFADAVEAVDPRRAAAAPTATAASAAVVRADVRAALAGRPFGSRAALHKAPRFGAEGRSRERSGGERWFALESYSSPLDALAADEILREKARRLLNRYGCLSRSIAALDALAPPWSALFRSLRLMEFAGEVTGGRFFDELDELQFVRAEEAAVAVEPFLYCLCACDPVSLCGLQPLAAALRLPPRIASSHVVWRSSAPVLVSKRNGRELDFRVDSDSEDAVAAVSILARRLVGRAVDPLGKLLVETIGGESANRSPYAAVLRSAHFVDDPKGLVFYAGGIT